MYPKKIAGHPSDVTRLICGKRRPARVQRTVNKVISARWAMG